jgi:hypothetical protein
VIASADTHGLRRRVEQLCSAPEAVQIPLICFRFQRPHLGRTDRRTGPIRRRKARETVVRFRFEKSASSRCAVAASDSGFGFSLEALRHRSPRRHPGLVFGALEPLHRIEHGLQIVEQVEPPPVKASCRDDKWIFIGADGKFRE